MKFILGKKLNMTRIFSDDGQATPVTAVAAGPCTIVDVMTAARDKYNAVQVGFGNKKKIGKALKGHLKNLGDFRYLKEFRLDKVEGIQPGAQIFVTSFEPGDKVKVTGVSKGKGSQGVVKRHGFHGSPASHGHKDQLRMPGSIGATDAARVFKGMRMGGQMGNAQVSVANLEIVKVDKEKNVLYIKGAVPGARGTLLLIKGPGEMKLETVVKPIKTETETEKKIESKDKKSVAGEKTEPDPKKIEEKNK